MSVSGITTEIDAKKARVETAGVRSTIVAITQAGLKKTKIEKKQQNCDKALETPAELHRGNLQPKSICCTFRFLASREPQLTK